MLFEVFGEWMQVYPLSLFAPVVAFDSNVDVGFGILQSTYLLPFQ